MCGCESDGGRDSWVGIVSVMVVLGMGLSLCLWGEELAVDVVCEHQPRCCVAPGFRLWERHVAAVFAGVVVVYLAGARGQTFGCDVCADVRLGDGFVRAFGGV